MNDWQWVGRWLVATALLAVTGVEVASAGSEKSKLSIELERTGGDDDGLTGRVDFRGSGKKGQFKVSIKNGPEDSVLKLMVDGVEEDTFSTDSKGKAKVTYMGSGSSSKTRPLDFDPRGREIEIRGNDDSPLLASSLAGSRIREGSILLPTGVQPLAGGSTDYRIKQGVQAFKVEVEDLADGDYALLIDGIERAMIEVSGGRGEVEFANPTDDPGKLFLDFEVYGKLVQVAQGATVVLSGEVRAGVPGVNLCTPAETTTPLNNVGPDGDASGEARLRVRDDCRVDFDVEIEDLPVGDYTLVVDGVVRGTMTVTNVVGGTAGEIEFSHPLDDDGQHELLNFDPTGATIEIKQGATVYLSATGAAVQPGVCSVIDEELDMVNAGADADAKGKARLRQETDCDRDLRVEIEKLPLGDYDLLVGGLIRGTVNVVLVGGEPVGHIEFDNDPDQPGELLLNFDPRGQFVEIRQGGTLYLSVTLPN